MIKSRLITLWFHASFMIGYANFARRYGIIITGTTVDPDFVREEGTGNFMQ